jgi:hypothetical protein
LNPDKEERCDEWQVGKKGSQDGKFEGQVGKIELQVGIGIPDEGCVTHRKSC